MPENNQENIIANRFQRSIKDLYLEEVEKQLNELEKEAIEKIGKWKTNFLTKVANNISITITNSSDPLHAVKIEIIYIENQVLRETCPGGTG